MALYKYKEYLDDSDHGAFDLLLRPDSIATNSGIYRCEVCGAEIVSEKSKELPPKDHHIHAEELGPTRWRLIVLAQPPGGLGVTVESISTPSRSPGKELALELDEDD
ncbi:MAG: hypothetical protein ACREV7_21890 [Steroidobacteraceae bacterium]